MVSRRLPCTVKFNKLAWLLCTNQQLVLDDLSAMCTECYKYLIPQCKQGDSLDIKPSQPASSPVILTSNPWNTTRTLQHDSRSRPLHLGYMQRGRIWLVLLNSQHGSQHRLPRHLRPLRRRTAVLGDQVQGMGHLRGRSCGWMCRRDSRVYWTCAAKPRRWYLQEEVSIISDAIHETTMSNL